MRLLANENFPLMSVRFLRAADHDVAAIIEDAPGATDADVLAQAAREARVILTFDRDYGEPIYRYQLPNPRGVIYLRFDPTTPQEPGERVLALLIAEEIVLEGKFTVVERERLRQRPLPSPLV
jgi:predicted nuclease of predicted toxin-antitoxin system